MYQNCHFIHSIENSCEVPCEGFPPRDRMNYRGPWTRKRAGQSARQFLKVLDAETAIRRVRRSLSEGGI
jgi:hypothetical protein